MNDTYAIVNVSTGITVDVVYNLCCTIGAMTKLEQLNPSLKFNYRKASKIEQEQAHLLQRDAARSNVVFHDVVFMND